MIKNITDLIREGIIFVAGSFLSNDLYGAKLAERTGNIYWERKFKDRFEAIARAFEDSEDISLKEVIKPYRLLMQQLNSVELPVL